MNGDTSRLVQPIRDDDGAGRSVQVTSSDYLPAGISEIDVTANPLDV